VPVLPVAAAPAAAPSPAAPRLSFGDVLRARAPPAPAAAPQAAARFLEAVERARERLDTALAEARRGRTFTAAELLALQADAYRAGQTLELASKVVEQGAAAVRQAVNTQV
jgi:hypothetical protein